METKQASVLVTGASGFIGEALCRVLLLNGCCVRGMRCNSRRTNQDLSDNVNFQWINGNINDAETCNLATENIDFVYHLAGLAHANGHSRETLWTVNIDGTETLLNAARRQKVKKIVYVSSSMATSYDKPLDKGSDQQQSDYGESKFLSEMLLKNQLGPNPIDFSIARPVNVYGPRMKGNILGLVKMVKMPWFPRLPRTENQISLIGVNDLITALILLANSEAANSKTYTLTDGKIYSTSSIENDIYSALGKKKPILIVPNMLLYVAAILAGSISKIRRKKGGISARTYRNLKRNNLYSNEKIRDELGFTPKQNFAQLLPEIIEQL